MGRDAFENVRTRVLVVHEGKLLLRRRVGARLRIDNGSGFRAHRFIEHAEALGFHTEHIQAARPRTTA